jgi:hypothetical protein
MKRPPALPNPLATISRSSVHSPPPPKSDTGASCFLADLSQSDPLQAEENTPSLLPTVTRVVLTVRQFSKRHPAFSEGSLRDLIFKSQSRHSSKGLVPGNGLDAALLRLGRRVLIDEQRFFEWLDRQGRRN